MENFSFDHKNYKAITSDFVYNIDESECKKYRKHLRSVLKSFGVVVYKNSKADLLEHNELARTIWGMGGAAVLYDDTLPIKQQVISLAHELGHVILHANANRFRNDHGTKHIMELEAEIFAYAYLQILMKSEGKDVKI